MGVKKQPPPPTEVKWRPGGFPKPVEAEPEPPPPTEVKWRPGGFPKPVEAEDADQG